MKEKRCPECGMMMKPKRFANRKALGLYISADLLIGFGLVAAIVIPTAGLVAGIIFILIGIYLMLKVQRGWECTECKVVVPDFVIFKNE